MFAREVALSVAALIPEPLWRMHDSPFFQRGRRNRLRRHPRQFARQVKTHRGDFTYLGTSSEFIDRHIYMHGEWDRGVSEEILSSLRPGDFFIDVGANTGYFSLLASLCIGIQGKVFAFEPSPRAVSMFEMNMRANASLASRVVLSSVALGSREDVIQLTLGPDGNLGKSSLHTVAAGTSSNSVAVSVSPGDRILDFDIAPRVRLVKIDVEGGEFDVLLGMADFLKCLPIGASVIVEVTPSWLQHQSRTTTDLLRHMSGCGFDLTRILLPDGQRICDPESMTEVGVGHVFDSFVQADLVFCKT